MPESSVCLNKLLPGACVTTTHSANKNRRVPIQLHYPATPTRTTHANRLRAVFRWNRSAFEFLVWLHRDYGDTTVTDARSMESAFTAFAASSFRSSRLHPNGTGSPRFFSGSSSHRTYT